ncbi:hypothetical protein ICN46_00045 [Polynucleobacter sp. Latsch14-2]|jgi:hypothetical protein|uniref:hypothetical protein n=1 Tax=Polynucleobacter sp. Latsch14-2 TaxID=2576920 RepID=UPI001C0D49C0|nr:hypothetical protein [Polynucleobacter sp. Latsch14-2]MBU3613285.1 hypothetical protein [Polynucleobacter sp. Latsch14-2]
MTKLNCAVGDIAITVNCHNPENHGNIVSVKSAYGMQGWGKGEPEFTWECEILSSGWLVYDIDGYITTSKEGLIPDHCLRPITPPKNYLMDQLAKSEQMNIDLYETETI